MRKLMFGVAAAALAASGVLAAPGKEHAGNHPENPKGGPEKARHGPSPGPDDKPETAARAADHKPAAHQRSDVAVPAAHEKPERNDLPRQAHDGRPGPDRALAEHGSEPDERPDAVRQPDPHRDAELRAPRPDPRPRPQRVAARRVDNDRIFRIHRYNPGPLDGCPPGLRKKHNGCLPPGQAKKLYDRRAAWSRPAYYGYDGWNDGRYLYDDGYLLRLNDGGNVLGYLPLLGGALSIGNPWPESYRPVQVSDYYVDYYNLGPQGGYRYADDVLYRVDPQDTSITSIAALLTGDQFDVGQRMPSGYDIYNVPYAYRDRYHDTPDANYRYADGYVYEVDPTTQLIQAAIELLI